MKKNVTVKMNKFVIFGVIFLFGTIILKMLYVAISNTVDGVNLQKFKDNRNTQKEVIYAKRGNIYDVFGEKLATTVNSYTLIAYLDENRTIDINKPQHVIDKEYTARVLNEELGIPYDLAITQLCKNAYQVEFGKNGKGIKESVKNKIMNMNLPGIDFIEGSKRTYNMGEFASYIIGYAKESEEGDITGELGIESFYDKELSGKDGSISYETDAYGYKLPSANEIVEKSINGYDIYLTIDSNIQLFAENLVNKLKKKYEMEWMIFTVMDANTGAIVASSTYPNFNPNDLGTISNYMNPLVSFEYEPGSVMKTFSFATAIEEGIYHGDKKFESGSIKVADAVIKDFNKTGWGKISYDTGFAYSSNVAATKLGLELGASKLTDYYTNLGFGKKTGITLSNESKGKLDINNQVTLANVSFGQGLTVTPIQMLQALSCLTNNGTTIKPYIVDKMVSNNQIIYEGKKEEVNKVFSEDTITKMHELLKKVVYDGLNKNYQPTKTTMIGKTGTAQIASPKGGYLTGEYNYVRSFAGIFPEEEPKYIVYVAVSKINSSATPIAKALVETVDNIVSYVGFQEKDEINSKIIKLDNYISKYTTEVKDDLKGKNLKVYILGKGKYITNQYPLKGTKILENSKVYLVTNDDNYVMENLTGWSLSEVITYSNLLKIPVNIIGSGYVIHQNIEEGTVINKDDILEITLVK